MFWKLFKVKLVFLFDKIVFYLIFWRDWWKKFVEISIFVIINFFRDIMWFMCISFDNKDIGRWFELKLFGWVEILVISWLLFVSIRLRMLLVLFEF